MRNSLHFFLISAIFAKLQVSLCIDENPEESFGELYWKTISRNNSNEYGYQGREIVGGVNAKKGEFPWIVGLWYNWWHVDKCPTCRPYCGGAIIDKRWVLTAAHCVKTDSTKPQKRVKIVAGDYSAKTKESQEQHVPVCKIHLHPDYISKRNDIALLELCEDLTWTSSVKPILLPAPHFTVPTSATVTVAGWGRTTEGGTTSDILKKVDLKSLSNSVCTKYYGHNGDITKGAICAGAPGKDSCQGDSGGPLSHKSNGKNYVVGAVSFGRGCARPDGPGVYAYVPHYRKWIGLVMSKKEHTEYQPSTSSS